MSTSSSPPSRKAGLTLIEVAAALALLSTLLVGILVAFGRHERQIRHCRRTLDVVREVDALIYGWLQKGGSVPNPGGGPLPGNGEFLWKTLPVSSEYRQRLGIDVVRLEVYSGSEDISSPPILVLDLPIASAEWGAENFR